MREAFETAYGFIDFISESPTKYHAVENIKRDLYQHGFQPLAIDEEWTLEVCGKYFIEQDNASLIAFCMGHHKPKIQTISKYGIRMVCAHTDSPAFKLKPIPQMITQEGHLRLNTQEYAWPILSTWFDRPLSLAGRVALKGESPFCPSIHLIDIKDPILIIPHLAIHLTKEEKGKDISRQKEMMPVVGIATKGDNTNHLMNLIARQLDVSEESILDHELYLYPVERGRLVGLNREFIVTPRQDDLSMVYAAYKALIETSDSTSIKMMTLFDAEEENNAALGGADTPFLRNVLTKITQSLRGDTEELLRMIDHSFAVSLDTSFAMHPNYTECSDPTCSPLIDQGIVIKYDANMHYATTAFSAAVFQEICRKKNIPFQKEATHSDYRTGRTVSTYMQTQVGMRCVEVGIPIWSMHSAYETCGANDLFYLTRALKHYWEIEK